MKKFFRYTKTDKLIRLSLQIAALLLIAQLGYIAFSYRSLPILIPLFNQLSWGEARFGQRFEIFFPSIIVVIVFITNLLLLNHVYERMPLIARILGITILLISLLSFIFTIQTISILI